MQAIWSCIWGSWQIGIGDPGWGGWMIVAIYISAGLLSLRVAGGAVFPETSRGRERAFWGILGLVLLLLESNGFINIYYSRTANMFFILCNTSIMSTIVIITITTTANWLCFVTILL